VIFAINASGESNDTSAKLATLLQLTLDKFQAIPGDIVHVSARLLNGETPLANENIIFYNDDKTLGEKATDDNGVATIDINTSTFTSGKYTIYASYLGSEKYSLSGDNSKLTIDNLNDISTNTTEVLSVAPQTESVPQEITPPVDPDIQSIQSCINNDLIEKEVVYENCTKNITQITCADAPLNQTCTTETKTVLSQCITYKDVVTPRQICDTKSYVIKNKYKLNIEGYACQPTKINDVVTVICDSQYDGNGDGICTSGESCLKYVFTNDKQEVYEKNSIDEYVASDDSFYLNKTTVEVLQ